MSGHIILLGDSIFDNAAYVTGGRSVLDHLRRLLPDDWEATLLAVDGATIASTQRQLQDLPDDATHLVLSVGGNDALGYGGDILSQLTDSVADALNTIAAMRENFSRQYRGLIQELRSFRLPLAICTVYDHVPGLQPPESAGLAIFNDEITRTALTAGATLIDLRLICTEAADYAEVSPIEPSETGGEKIAQAIHTALFEAEAGRRVVV